MAWLHNGITLKVGKSWSDGNYKHPYNWASAWSAEDKEHWGVTWQDDPDTSYDNRFYWAKDVPRSLTDINEVDDDGDAILDADGNQVVTLGLKSIWVAQTKTTANGLLASTDWYVTRKSESDVAIPSTISTYRSAVRTASGTIETAINSCADLDAFKALFVLPVDSDGNPTGNAPIYDFPDEV
tara:strand:+ start:2167 stop:2715 length:549 start_codon:yes stop_codon:yes gene_type:complete